MTLEEIIKPGKIDQHKDDWYGIGFLLDSVKGRLYILHKIEDFPLDLFTSILWDGAFWELVRRALLESTIVTLYTIIADKKTYHNLDRFVERIKSDYLLPEQITHRDIETRFESYRQRVAPLKKNVNLIRNNFVAHITDNALEVVTSLNELDECLELSYELLNMLSFGYYTTQTPLDYPPSSNILNRFTDVEYLLGFVASRSVYLRQDNADYLARIQKERLSHLTQKQLSFVREWGERIELMGIKR